MTLVKALVEKLGGKKFTAQLFLFFSLWSSFWDYYEGLELIAKSGAQEKAALWGSLAIFLQMFNHGIFVIEKVLQPALVATAGHV